MPDGKFNSNGEELDSLSDAQEQNESKNEPFLGDLLASNETTTVFHETMDIPGVNETEPISSDTMDFVKGNETMLMSNNTTDVAGWNETMPSSVDNSTISTI